MENPHNKMQSQNSSAVGTECSGDQGSTAGVILEISPRVGVIPFNVSPRNDFSDHFSQFIVTKSPVTS